MVKKLNKMEKHYLDKMEEDGWFDEPVVAS